MKIKQVLMDDDFLKLFEETKENISFGICEQELIDDFLNLEEGFFVYLIKLMTVDPEDFVDNIDNKTASVVQELACYGLNKILDKILEGKKNVRG